MKKHKTYILTILINLFIFYFAIIYIKKSPLGNHVLGISDGIAQFKPMIYDLIMKIKTGTLEMYSFNNGLGNPFIFNFLYYTGSPINLIGLLFNNPDSIYLAIITLKIILASITMTFYTSKKTDRKDVIIISSISYVFCTWFIVYYFYLAWVDIFFIFPLFQYGLEKNIDSNKISYCYIFSLAYMFLTNYYLSFAVCIYTLIYYIIYGLFYLKRTKKEKLQSFIRMAIATLLTFLLSFFVIYELYRCSIKMGITLESFKSLYSINIKRLFQSLLYGEYTFFTESRTAIVFPNIACNMFILINVIHYFFNRNIQKREKLFAIIGIIIIFLFLSNKYLDFMINFFHQIRGWPYRYSFIISFLMIKLYIRNSTTKKSDEYKKEIFLSLLLTFSLIFLLRDTISVKLLVYIVFFACFLINIKINGNNKIDKLITIILIIMESLMLNISIQLYFDINITEPSTKETYKTEIQKNRTNYIDISAYKDELFNLNSNLYSNTKSSTLMTSMTYSKVIYMIRDLDNFNFLNAAMKINNYNIISRMLFNEYKEEATHYLEKIYSVNKDIKELKLKEKAYKDNQENLINKMTGIDRIFEKTSLKGKEVINQCWVSREELSIIRKKKVIYYDNLSINNNELFTSKEKCKKELDFYTYDAKQIIKAHDYLKKNQIEYTYYSDSKLEGNINVDKDQLIFTSIPYDTNWDIYIDGNKVKPIKLLDSLIGIETTPGKHKIKMEYKEHFLIPLSISLVTFIILMINLITGKKRYNER